MILQNKVAIVTGGASGIGRAIALALGKEGASVAIADVDIDGAKTVAEELKAQGNRSVVTKTDVSEMSDVKAVVERTVEEFKKVDILVNNAAYLGFSKEHKPFIDTEEAEWDQHIKTTLKGTLNCCKAVIPYMIAQKRGRIINITSDAAKSMAPEGESLYAAAKCAVVGFSRCLAGELARHKILVNCVAPGFTMTPPVKNTRPQEWIDKVTAVIPLRRAGEPEEVANMVLFLTSEKGDYITGQHYSVNGGLTMI
jgi:2-hydroxycyclohexanecarboxyl-CoA dehydrogenase